MNNEVELKLALDPGDAAAFRRHPLLREKAIEGPTRRRVFNIYFDSPGLVLREHRMALRLRKAGGKWLQTLKTAGSLTGGLHQRGEWELPLPAPQLDLALFRETPLAKLADSKQLHLTLKPAFTTDFQRTIWLIETAPGQRVEVALDQGWARCGSKEGAICEVEIELIEGGAAAAFDVALVLAEKIALQPDILSKAERGYRLFQPTMLTPHRAATVELDKKCHPHQALRSIAAACLDHFEANVEGALLSNDPEYIHQLRVSLRRLHSAMRIFKPVAQQRFAEELRWLSGVLGEARDWDVLVAESLPALLKGYGDAAFEKKLLAAGKRRATACRAAARAALTSRRHALLVIALGGWLSISDDVLPATESAQTEDDAKQAVHAEGLSHFASREIRRRNKRLMGGVDALAGLSSEARHRVRIDAKRLRYAVDFFSSLFTKRRVAQYLKTLAGIQEVLGKANDAAVAERLIVSLAPPEPFIHFARGWLTARTQAQMEGIATHFAGLKKTRRFWLKKSTASQSADNAKIVIGAPLKIQSSPKCKARKIS